MPLEDSFLDLPPPSSNPPEYLAQKYRLPYGFAACLNGRPTYSDSMKKFITSVSALLLVWSSHAQVSVEIVMDQDDFLVGEAIPAAVRIVNRSGQTLQLGADANWINFTMEGRNGAIVAKNGEVPVQGAFTLESGKVATRRVDLAPYFALNQVGRYRLNASVQIKDWDSTLSAKPKGFDVIKGATLWSQEFGMLLPAGATNRIPEVRRYSLEQANHLRGQLRLYLRITGGDGQILKVLPIGQMVSISNPEHQIDRGNNLHVLYQLGARTYLYAVVTPDGEMLIRQTHEITTSRPRLQADDKGNFSVNGGARRHSIDDLPGETDSTASAAHAPTPP